MTAWMVWASLVTLLLAAAAASVEWALRLFGRPVRPIWVGTAAGSVVLMAASRLTPSPSVPRAPAGAGLEGVAADLIRKLTAGVGTAPSVLQRADDVVLWGWAAASTMLIAGLVIGLWRLGRRARSWPVAVVDGKEVLLSESFGPALIGVFAPRIVVPRWALRLGPERLRMACLHESEHRRGGDGLLLLGSALVAALAPWNPGLWWIHVRLRAAVEMDCDARVLRAGARPVAYGTLLLELSTRAAEVPRMVAAFARPRATLERRMTMIVRDRRRVGAAGWGRAAAAVAGGVLLVVVACGAPAPTESASTAADPEAQTITVTERAAEREPLDPSGRTIRLRGTDGGAAGDPLIYVDGIRVEGSDFLDELSPDRVERIEVIKGAAAVAFYGEEAAAGVIQIFLKEGVSR